MKKINQKIKATSLYIAFRKWKRERRARKKYAHTDPEKYKSIVSHLQWIQDDADNTLRLNYPLDENSIVFDIGGYHGNFAEAIYKKYECEIYIFEPIKEFYQMIVERFKNNNKIKVFNFGLSDIDRDILISVSDDASSVHTKSKNKETIQLQSVSEFIKRNNITYISLMKINVEGDEFEILPELIQSQLMANIENIQVQFHAFIDDAVSKRNDIRKKLSKTHKLTYDYYFIWENWELRL